jgi:hypothetical protein
MQENPEIREAREYFNPVARAAAFARLYLPANRMLPQDTLLALISQHLRILGLSETQASLHAESGAELKIPPHKLSSQLGILIQRSVHRTERFWELALPSVHACETVKATQTALDEEISRTIGAAPTLVEDTAPIKNERPLDDHFLKTEENSVEPVEASLNQLIFCLTTSDPARDTSPFLAELRGALCLTISSYCSSKIFLQKLRDRFSMIKESAASGGSQTAELEVPLFIRLFQEWVKGVLNDLEAQVLEDAQRFVNKELMPKYARYCAKMFEQSTNRVQSTSPEKQLQKVDLGGNQALHQGLWTGNFSLLDLPLQELARQFTVWSSTRYYAIRRCELLDCAWEKPRLRYRAPNVVALTQHYNRLSQWVAMQVLDERNLEKRLQKMNLLVQLAQKLFDLQNYYDGMAVLSGFDSNSMFRLNGHVERLDQTSKDVLNNLREICVPAANFKELRSRYEQALRTESPVLPYIGVFLSDLFKYYDATQTFVNGLINVRKCKGVYKMITRIEEFCRGRFAFLPIDQVQVKIDQLEDLDEDKLIAMSYEVEKEDGTLLDEPEKKT